MMKKYKLTKYDAEHQLPLLAAPAVHLEVPQLQLDGPLPEAMPINENDSRRSSLRHGTGDASSQGKAWTAVLRVRGEIGWQCDHLHRSAEGSHECAWQARGIFLAHVRPVPPEKGAQDQPAIPTAPPSPLVGGGEPGCGDAAPDAPVSRAQTGEHTSSRTR
jgi:hypothetical protein